MDSFSTASSSSVANSHKESTETNWSYNDEGKFFEDTSMVDRYGFAFWNLVFFIAGLAIKVLSFQFYLLISPIMFPIWFLSQFCMLTFASLRFLRNILSERIVRISCSLLYKISYKLQKRYKNSENFARRTFHRIIRSVYVLFILLALLAIAFAVGTMIMQQIVEKPLKVESHLSFDYTKVKPDAFVSFNRAENTRNWNYLSWHFLPYSRKLRLTIFLTLPESDYNWKLGVFQVKAEFLSREGRVIYSSSHPCILHFKSSIIHHIKTLIKSGSIIFGYSLESQNLVIKMPISTEETDAIAHIRVVLEQRAEYNAAGAGIPEIYAACLKLELGFSTMVKRVIWIWKWTLLIWISMGFFFLELLIVALSYKPVLSFKSDSKSIEGASQKIEFLES